ncbi:DUF6985 domain-containing protein [Shewanella insulae]|uniref:DUF6985 domain-containing protein n=1 Tax=Shewanella insulae TaxID=2681496 RepID=UPI002480968F|nr:hypothetical protein [Shewanella insulae]
MFSKRIPHPIFKELIRGLFGYTARIDLLEYRDVQVRIKGRSVQNLEFAQNSLTGLAKNLHRFLEEATEDMYEGYKAIKEGVEAGEFDLEAEGGNLPIINNSNEVWKSISLGSIEFDPEGNLKIRLSFRCPWDIEHDFGMYVTSDKLLECGISV